MNLFTSVYRSLAGEVKEINRKYATPAIRVTPFVKASLLLLRLYLILLVGLLIYKFVSAVHQ